MNKEETKSAIAVMQAWLDGKEIQGYRGWLDIERNTPIWGDLKDKENCNWDWSSGRYRVKPEPHLRPYRNVMELVAGLNFYGYRILKNPDDKNPLILTVTKIVSGWDIETKVECVREGMQRCDKCDILTMAELSEYVFEIDGETRCGIIEM